MPIDREHGEPECNESDRRVNNWAEVFQVIDDRVQEGEDAHRARYIMQGLHSKCFDMLDDDSGSAPSPAFGEPGHDLLENGKVFIQQIFNDQVKLAADKKERMFWAPDRLQLSTLRTVSTDSLPFVNLWEVRDADCVYVTQIGFRTNPNCSLFSVLYEQMHALKATYFDNKQRSLKTVSAKWTPSRPEESIAI